MSREVSSPPEQTPLTLRTLLAVSGLLLAASISSAQTAYSFAVKVVGHGKPVILIPGLTCTGDVWDGTVKRLESKYQCHVLTLPGFGGQPPISGPFVTHVRDDILAYVREKKLDHPAVIGHSLGGFMVYNLAEADPNLWGPLIAVDGLPFLTLLYSPKATAESSKPYADMVSKGMRSATPAAFTDQVHKALESEITDPKNVEAMFVFSKRADQATTAEIFSEMMTTDLRPGLSAIRSRFLLIGAGQQATTPAQQDALTATYRSEISGIPGAELQMDWKARHFIMLDDPEFFYSSVEAFLSKG
jgi:pimeloyl-ACP methyl ester carboxylesterase